MEHLTKSPTSNFFESIFLRSWWMILFLLLCFMFFELGQNKRKDFRDMLSKQIIELSQNKEFESQKQEFLKMQLNSQSDPAWVELTLMRELGVVPEGQKKFTFIAPKTQNSITQNSITQNSITQNPKTDNPKMDNPKIDNPRTEK